MRDPEGKSMNLDNRLYVHSITHQIQNTGLHIISKNMNWQKVQQRILIDFDQNFNAGCG